MIQTVQTMEVPPLQFIDKVVDTPVVAQRQIYMDRSVQTIEIPQLQHTDQVVDVPVVLVAQVPEVRVVEQTVEISQLPLAEKIDVIPEIRGVQGTQTSESSNTALVRWVTQVEMVDVVETRTQVPRALSASEYG